MAQTTNSQVKGPGTSLSRPEVMRKKIGAAYDVYRPITEALAVD